MTTNWERNSVIVEVHPGMRGVVIIRPADPELELHSLYYLQYDTEGRTLKYPSTDGPTWTDCDNIVEAITQARNYYAGFRLGWEWPHGS
jgi:hypothetical protein